MVGVFGLEEGGKEREKGEGGKERGEGGMERRLRREARDTKEWGEVHKQVPKKLTPPNPTTGDEGEWGQSIGAFVWTKGSDMDRITPNETI